MSMNAEAGRKVSNYESAETEIINVIQALANELDGLYERLAPVLLPVANQDAGNKATPNPVASMVVGNMYSNTNKIRDMIDACKEVESRLEI